MCIQKKRIKKEPLELVSFCHAKKKKKETQIPALHEQPSSYLHPSPQHNSCFDGHCTLTADRSTAGAAAGAGAGSGAGAGAGAGAGSAFLAGALGSFLGAISADSRTTLSLKHRQFPVGVTTQGV